MIIKNEILFIYEKFPAIQISKRRFYLISLLYYIKSVICLRIFSSSLKFFIYTNFFEIVVKFSFLFKRVWEITVYFKVFIIYKKNNNILRFDFRW